MLLLSFTFSLTGALCAMKEVNIIPDDAKSAESLKQLEQVAKFDSLSYIIHIIIILGRAMFSAFCSLS